MWGVANLTRLLNFLKPLAKLFQNPTPVRLDHQGPRSPNLGNFAQKIFTLHSTPGAVKLSHNFKSHCAKFCAKNFCTRCIDLAAINTHTVMRAAEFVEYRTEPRAEPLLPIDHASDSVRSNSRFKDQEGLLPANTVTVKRDTAVQEPAIKLYFFDPRTQNSVGYFFSQSVSPDAFGTNFQSPLVNSAQLMNPVFFLDPTVQKQGIASSIFRWYLNTYPVAFIRDEHSVAAKKLWDTISMQKGSNIRSGYYDVERNVRLSAQQARDNPNAYRLIGRVELFKRDIPRG